jgi:hypothetical protein
MSNFVSHPKAGMVNHWQKNEAGIGFVRKKKPLTL